MTRILEILFAGIVLIAGAQFSYADGGFVSADTTRDIREPEQKAMIIYDNGLEDLILSVKFDGAPEDFGWIVPLPSVPKMAIDSSSLFYKLSRGTQKPKIGQSEYRRRDRLERGGGAALTIVEKQIVGIYDITIIRSESLDSLLSWFGRNSYQIDSEAGSIFDEYMRQSWVFVAMRINGSESDSVTANSLRTGDITPIRFQFRTEEPVYPLKISAINGGRSDIVLYVYAAEQLDPTPLPNVEWNVRVFGPKDIRFDYLDVSYSYPGLWDRKASLTKISGRIHANDMEDLYFTSYDPFPRLNSDDTIIRAEAATHLGRLRIPDGVDGLIDLLDRSTEESIDVFSSLWALGEIGTPEAISCLVQWCDHPSTVIQIEAVSALGLTWSPDAFPSLISGLLRTTPNDTVSFMGDYRAKNARELCFQNLMPILDSSHVDVLRELALSHNGHEAWHDPIVEVRRTNEEVGHYKNRVISATLGKRAVVALAVLGDSLSTYTLKAAIIEQSREVRDSTLEKRRDRPQIQTSTWIRKWKCFNAVNSMLEQRPEARDPLYHALMTDSRLPDIGKTIVISRMDDPGEPDLDTLVSIWQRAIATPRFISVEESDTTLTYNYKACAAAYAFAKLKACGRLLELLRTVPPSDEMLRAEVIYALALTHSPDALPAIIEYLKEEWNSTAASYKYTTALSSHNPRKSRLDLDYREFEIRRFFQSTPGASGEMDKIIVDPNIHPHLRLYWIRTNPYYGPKKSLRREAHDEAIDLLRSENHSDEHIVRKIESVDRLRSYWEDRRAARRARMPD